MVLPGIAFTGVELFFGLSGFLIGSILLSKKYSLKVFYLKRFMKILPPYLLILFAIFMASSFHNGDYFLAHAFFIHTLFPQMAGYFPVSWSLAIEFWFYLLVPLLLLNHVSKRNVGRQVLIISVATLAVLCLARLIYVMHLNPAWEFGVHRFVPLRFDTMIFGVVAAIIARQHRRLYNLLTKPVVVIGSLVALIASTWYFGYLYSHYVVDQAQLFQSVGLTIVGASIMILILFALKYTGSGTKRMPGGLTKITLFISSTSYSLYLVHLFVFLWISTQLGTGWLAYCCALVISLVTAWLFYESVEKWALKLSGWLHKKYFAKDTPPKQAIETEIARQP
jgi:peptidoglycan/LPS O-acetylase OafA/YrhL